MQLIAIFIDIHILYTPITNILFLSNIFIVQFYIQYLLTVLVKKPNTGYLERPSTLVTYIYILVNVECFELSSARYIYL